MKVKEHAWVAFCEHSWKVFHSEVLAMEWVKDREGMGEFWSVTSAIVEFAYPKRVGAK